MSILFLWEFLFENHLSWHRRKP